jgi:hypothetical protein
LLALVPTKLMINLSFFFSFFFFHLLQISTWWRKHCSWCIIFEIRQYLFRGSNHRAQS